MEALADAGADATAMVRVEAKAADLPGAPRHVVATFDDPPPAEILQDWLSDERASFVGRPLDVPPTAF